MEPRTFLYRTQIHRRTLLGSGAFVGVGALLATCGQQANNEAAATASAAPSETASASAAASESPRRVLLRLLFVATPADPRHRMGSTALRISTAQPRTYPNPPQPEGGYNEKSLEGLRKTMDAWINGVIMACRLAIIQWLAVHFTDF